MTYQQQPDGHYAAAMDDTHSQPRFLGWLAVALGIFAIAVALVALCGAFFS